MNMTMESRIPAIPLVLGTAQFASAYGIANRTGVPDEKTVMEIVRTAWENQIVEFDTAQGYGDSEKRLGRALKHLGLTAAVRVITKFHPGLDHLDERAITDALHSSAKILNMPRLHCVLLHREDMLDLWSLGLRDILGRLVRDGIVEKLGVSVYSPKRALEAIGTEGIEVVQLPTNILDRRFERAGVFEEAELCGKTIYVRSVFLQGLLLMKPEGIPPRLATAKPLIESLRVLAARFGMTQKEVALSYVKYAIPSAKVIIGAELPSQIKENRDLWVNASSNGDLIEHVRALFPSVEEAILDPSRWPSS